MKPHYLLTAIALLASGCAQSATAPSASTASTTIVLAGQSNAYFMRPYLTDAAAPMHVDGFAQDGSSIAEWGVGVTSQWTSGHYWDSLIPSLHQPLQAFVWWQGESDASDPEGYAVALREFVQRVRTEARDAYLLIVVCRVVEDPAFVGLRAVQEAYVRVDSRSVLVSSDGLPREHPDWLSGSAHLSPEGYRTMAMRVLDALHR